MIGLYLAATSGMLHMNNILSDNLSKIFGDIKLPIEKAENPIETTCIHCLKFKYCEYMQKTLASRPVVTKKDINRKFDYPIDDGYYLCKDCALLEKI